MKSRRRAIGENLKYLNIILTIIAVLLLLLAIKIYCPRPYCSKDWKKLHYGKKLYDGKKHYVEFISTNNYLDRKTGILYKIKPDREGEDAILQINLITGKTKTIKLTEE